MASTRYEHSATVLTNGNVLVSGGSDDSGMTLSSVEIYNAASGKWLTVAPLHVARKLHTATLLPNGWVLIAGGFSSGSPLSSAELYNPVLGTWTVTNSMTAARWNHAATLLTNGSVLVSGGYNGMPLSNAEVYVSSTGIWKPVHPMNVKRDWLAATLLPNGKTLVTAGSDVAGNGNGGAQSSAELYDPVADTWTMTGPMVARRYEHTSTLLPGGQVLVAGGTTNGSDELSSAELFNPTNQTWSATSAMNPGRRFQTATLLPNLKVLVAGGSDNSSEVYTYTSPTPTPIYLTDFQKFPAGAFQFWFTNAPGASFSVLATTNLSSPPMEWADLGGATEVLPGQFRFTDLQATNNPQRFYHVRFP